MAILVRLDGKEGKDEWFQTYATTAKGIKKAARDKWGTSLECPVWMGCRVLSEMETPPDGSTVDIDTRMSPRDVMELDKYEAADLLHERDLLANIALLAVEVAMHSDHPLTDSLLEAIKAHRKWQLDRFGYSDDRFEEVRDLLVAMHEDMEGRSD